MKLWGCFAAFGAAREEGVSFAKNRAAATAATVMLIGALSACGGGGGGGGGGGLALSPAATTSTGTTTTTATAPAMTVKANGAVLTPDGSGAYMVKPGDQIAVEAASSVMWTAASEVAGAVTTNSVQSGAKTWNATLLHDGSAEDKFFLNAKYGSGAAETLQIVFRVAAASSPNGSYRLFSAVGAEFLFKLNLDLNQFALYDKSGNFVRSGTLKADPTTAGTYLMVDNVTPASTSNNARFRITADTLVGAMAMPLPYPNANGNLMAFPFVATRNVVTDRTAFDGLYNRLDLTLVPSATTGLPSTTTGRVRQIQIGGQAATLDQCNEPSTISPISSCIGAGKTLVHYVGAAAPDSAGNWSFTNVADFSDKLTFVVARIDGDNVLLEAGSDPLAPTNGVFRIAMPSVPDFADLVAYGGSPLADWTKFTVAGSTITMNTTSLSGATTTASFPLLLPSPGEPQGFRKIDLGGGGVSFAIRSSGLYASMGYVNLNTGLVQIGLTH